MLKPMMLWIIAAFLPQDQSCKLPPGTMLPDMVTAIPQHIGIHNVQQQEWLRFTNNIVNIGLGDWWMECDLDGEITSENLPAYQVFNDGGNISLNAAPPASDVEGYLGRCEIGEFEFHPEHNHWHIAEVADYRLCHKDDFNPLDPAHCETEMSAEKVTFCLIDWTKIGDKTSVSDDSRSFWDCYTGFQGISPGWGDQYHHSLPDQGIDITDAPDGTYYLVTTVNKDGIFYEENEDNNSSWVKLVLGHEGNGNGGNGNRKLTISGNACDDDEAFRDRLEEDVKYYVDSSGTDVAADDFIDELCYGVGTNR